MRKRVVLTVSLLLILSSLLAFGGLTGCMRRVSQPVAAVLPPEATATATLYPTATPTQTPTPLPTATPTMTPIPIPVPAVTVEVEVPLNQVPEQFTVELTEEQLNEMAMGQSFAQEGVQVRDATVRVTGGQVISHFNVTHAETGISTDITIYAVPRVVDGQVYLQIQDFELGDSIRGFARVIAEGVIKQMLQSYSGEFGIPVPIEGVRVDDLQVKEGALVVTGQRVG